MTRATRCCAMIIATCVVLAAPASRSWAQSTAAPPPTPAPATSVKPLGESLTGEARTKYDIGRILYRDGDYSGALANFRRAYDLSKEPRLLWNMAACEKNLHQYPRVLELVSRYLTEADAILTDDDRAEARAFAAAVTKLVASVKIDVTEPDAEVLVDDEVVGRSPLAAPVIVTYGKHRFRARKSGFIDAAEALEIQEGQSTAVRLEPKREVHGGRLIVSAAAGDAISLDGQRAGERSFDGTVPAGPHVVEVSAPSKKKRTIEIVMRDGETRNLDVELVRDSATIWPWFVAGGVAIAGAVVGGYFLFRSKDAAPVSGTALTYELP
jgi:hypothetical protein